MQCSTMLRSLYTSIRMDSFIEVSQAKLAEDDACRGAATRISWKRIVSVKATCDLLHLTICDCNGNILEIEFYNYAD